MAWFKTQNLSGPLRETSCRTDREYYETEQLSSRTGRGVERNEANISANQQGISNNRVDIDANLRQITSLSQNMDVLRSDVDQNRAGVSMAMAMASIPYSVADRFSIGIGLGAFGEETSFAAGGQFKFNNRILLRGSIAKNGSDTGYGAGVGIGF